ncbi:MAG: D-cysteine desulfhydrase family protein [Candidatus Latescibacteria bacterium]|nr:D-cysteine desulfhydrase family protein [Candidatus Latescibacterota bacterium]
MSASSDQVQALRQLPGWPRLPLAQLPTPIHPLPNFSREVGREVWIKRDDLTGLAGGGNKTRKLEFLVGDAVETGADMVATVGAIQSNHTRQTAAAAARAGIKCSLLHYGWTKDAGEHYRKVGNILLSSVMGADLYLDDTDRPIEDNGPLDEFGDYLETQGHRPYLIPGGGSDHRLGSLGYVACAAEIVSQMSSLGTHFDYVVHCTGSGGTQAGLIAGFKALDCICRVIGIPDDYETDIKRERVLRLSNATLTDLDVPIRVQPGDVEIVASDMSPYGIADQETYRAIDFLARSEGLMADPVYEGKAVRGLLDLVCNNRFGKDSRILLLHLGGTPAVHAYANQFEPIELRQSPV